MLQYTSHSDFLYGLNEDEYVCNMHEMVSQSQSTLQASGQVQVTALFLTLISTASCVAWHHPVEI